MARTTDRIKQIQLNEKDITEDIRSNIELVVSKIHECRNSKDAVKYMLMNFNKIYDQHSKLYTRYHVLEAKLKMLLQTEFNLNHENHTKISLLQDLDDIIKKDRL